MGPVAFGLLVVMVTLVTLAVRTAAIMIGFGVLHHESAVIPAIGFPVAAILYGLVFVIRSEVTVDGN